MVRSIVRDGITQESWAGTFLREFDLVIAANEMAYKASGQTLYNDVLNERVAARCMTFDMGLLEDFRGIIPVPPNEEAPYRRVGDATAFLKTCPRGTWAVFEMDGRYDAYMSDGYGGLGTRSGHKFTAQSSLSPDLTFLRTYAAVLSYSIYTRANEINAEILGYSSVKAGILPGATVERDDIYFHARKWSKATLVEAVPDAFVGGTPGFKVRYQQRGLKPVEAVLEPGSFVSLFKLPLIVPPRYQDPGNETRVSSLPEDREMAAQKAWQSRPRESDILDRGTRAPFRQDGDEATRPVWREGDSGVPSEMFAVAFEPGTSIVLSAGIRVVPDETILAGFRA